MQFTPDQEARIRQIVAEAMGWNAAIRRSAGTGSQRGPKPKPERDAAIAEHYLGGASLLMCATKFGVAPGTVRSALVRQGIETRQPGQPPRQKPDDRLEAFIERRNAGATLEEIAAEFHITRERVRQIFSKAGIDTSQETRPLTPEQRDLVDRYASSPGESLGVLAHAAGVSSHTFRNWVLRSGHAIRRQHSRKEKVADETADVVAERYLAGEHPKEIAASLGLKHVEHIYRYLARAGVRPNRQPGLRARRQEAA